MSVASARNQFPLWPTSTVLGQWKASHDYDIWTDCRASQERQLTLWEARKGGVVRLPNTASLMHVIPGGVAHHVEGLFGYWRACDSDIIWLRVERDGLARNAMILGGSPGDYKKDHILWICPACAATIHDVEIETGRARMDLFWAREREIVAAFNADERQRTCPSCTHVHPPAYTFRTKDAKASGPSDLAW